MGVSMYRPLCVHAFIDVHIFLYIQFICLFTWSIYDAYMYIFKIKVTQFLIDFSFCFLKTSFKVAVFVRSSRLSDLFVLFLVFILLSTLDSV